MQTIEINNKKYSVLFSTWAIMMIEEMTGRPFYDLIMSLIPEPDPAADEMEIGLKVLRSAPVKDMAKMLFAGIAGGEKKEGKEQSFKTLDELLNALDAGGEILPPLSSAFFYALASLPTGDGKKKEVAPPAAT